MMILANILFLFRATLVVDLSVHRWILYRGPVEISRGIAVGGRGLCPETGKRACYTPRGYFHIRAKRGRSARSSLYPVECKNKRLCGVEIPYAMLFGPRGESIHAGHLPRVIRNVSHGCVRVSPTDAYYLWKTLSTGSTVVIW